MLKKIISSFFYLLVAIHVVSCTHNGSAGRACIVTKLSAPDVPVRESESPAGSVQPASDSAVGAADRVLDAMESRNRSASAVRAEAEPRKRPAAVAHYDRVKIGPRPAARAHQGHFRPHAGHFHRSAARSYHQGGHITRPSGRLLSATRPFGYDEESAKASLYASAVQQGGGMPADLAELEITETMAGKIWGELDSREKLERVKVLAEQYPNACFLLGIAYEHGLIVQQSWRAATIWYERALAKKYELAREHYAEGAYQVALLCRDDKKERASWYKKSAEVGHKEALCSWGICLWRGIGVAPDPAAAMELFRQSAHKGCCDALFMQGIAYWEGRGVLRNYPQAIVFFTQAKERGDIHSLYYLGLAHEHGIAVPRNAGQAEKYYQMAAENGDANACCALGNMYYNGSLGVPNQKNAVLWYGKAAASNHREALQRLVRIYTHGCPGIPPSAALASEYRQRLQSKMR